MEDDPIFNALLGVRRPPRNQQPAPRDQNQVVRGQPLPQASAPIQDFETPYDVLHGNPNDINESGGYGME